MVSVLSCQVHRIHLVSLCLCPCLSLRTNYVLHTHNPLQSSSRAPASGAWFQFFLARCTEFISSLCVSVPVSLSEPTTYCTHTIPSKAAPARPPRAHGFSSFLPGAQNSSRLSVSLSLSLSQNQLRIAHTQSPPKQLPRARLGRMVSVLSCQVHRIHLVSLCLCPCLSLGTNYVLHTHNPLQSSSRAPASGAWFQFFLARCTEFISSLCVSVPVSLSEPTTYCTHNPLQSSSRAPASGAWFQFFLARCTEFISSLCVSVPVSLSEPTTYFAHTQSPPKQLPRARLGRMVSVLSCQVHRIHLVSLCLCPCLSLRTNYVLHTHNPLQSSSRAPASGAWFQFFLARCSRLSVSLSLSLSLGTNYVLHTQSPPKQLPRARLGRVVSVLSWQGHRIHLVSLSLCLCLSLRTNYVLHTHNPLQSSSRAPASGAWFQFFLSGAQNSSRLSVSLSLSLSLRTNYVLHTHNPLQSSSRAPASGAWFQFFLVRCTEFISSLCVSVPLSLRTNYVLHTHNPLQSSSRAPASGAWFQFFLARCTEFISSLWVSLPVSLSQNQLRIAHTQSPPKQLPRARLGRMVSVLSCQVHRIHLVSLCLCPCLSLRTNYVLHTHNPLQSSSRAPASGAWFQFFLARCTEFISSLCVSVPVSLSEPTTYCTHTQSPPKQLPRARLGRMVSVLSCKVHRIHLVSLCLCPCLSLGTNYVLHTHTIPSKAAPARPPRAHGFSSFLPGAQNSSRLSVSLSLSLSLRTNYVLHTHNLLQSSSRAPRLGRMVSVLSCQVHRIHLVSLCLCPCLSLRTNYVLHTHNPLQNSSRAPASSAWFQFFLARCTEFISSLCVSVPVSLSEPTTYCTHTIPSKAAPARPPRAHGFSSFLPGAQNSSRLSVSLSLSLSQNQLRIAHTQSPPKQLPRARLGRMVSVLSCQVHRIHLVSLCLCPCLSLRTNYVLHTHNPLQNSSRAPASGAWFQFFLPRCTEFISSLCLSVPLSLRTNYVVHTHNPFQSSTRAPASGAWFQFFLARCTEFISSLCLSVLVSLSEPTTYCTHTIPSKAAPHAPASGAWFQFFLARCTEFISSLCLSVPVYLSQNQLRIAHTHNPLQSSTPRARLRRMVSVLSWQGHRIHLVSLSLCLCLSLRTNYVLHTHNPLQSSSRAPASGAWFQFFLARCTEFISSLCVSVPVSLSEPTTYCTHTQSPPKQLPRARLRRMVSVLSWQVHRIHLVSLCLCPCLSLRTNYVLHTHNPLQSSSRAPASGAWFQFFLVRCTEFISSLCVSVLSLSLSLRTNYVLHTHNPLQSSSRAPASGAWFQFFLARCTEFISSLCVSVPVSLPEPTTYCTHTHTIPSKAAPARPPRAHGFSSFLPGAQNSSRLSVSLSLSLSQNQLRIAHTQSPPKQLPRARLGRMVSVLSCQVHRIHLVSLCLCPCLSLSLSQNQLRIAHTQSPPKQLPRTRLGRMVSVLSCQVHRIHLVSLCLCPCLSLRTNYVLHTHNPLQSSSRAPASGAWFQFFLARCTEFISSLWSLSLSLSQNQLRIAHTQSPPKQLPRARLGRMVSALSSQVHRIHLVSLCVSVPLSLSQNQLRIAHTQSPPKQLPRARLGRMVSVLSCQVHRIHLVSLCLCPCLSLSLRTNYVLHTHNPLQSSSRAPASGAWFQFFLARCTEFISSLCVSVPVSLSEPTTYCTHTIPSKAAPARPPRAHGFSSFLPCAQNSSRLSVSLSLSLSLRTNYVLHTHNPLQSSSRARLGRMVSVLSCQVHRIHLVSLCLCPCLSLRTNYVLHTHNPLQSSSRAPAHGRMVSVLSCQVHRIHLVSLCLCPCLSLRTNYVLHTHTIPSKAAPARPPRAHGFSSFLPGAQNSSRLSVSLSLSLSLSLSEPTTYCTHTIHSKTAPARPPRAHGFSSFLPGAQNSSRLSVSLSLSLSQNQLRIAHTQSPPKQLPRARLGRMVSVLSCQVHRIHLVSLCLCPCLSLSEPTTYCTHTQSPPKQLPRARLGRMVSVLSCQVHRIHLVSLCLCPCLSLRTNYVVHTHNPLQNSSRAPASGAWFQFFLARCTEFISSLCLSVPLSLSLSEPTT